MEEKAISPQTELCNMEQYINKYKGMIIYLAKRYGLYHKLELEDILQEGYLILWHALNTFNEQKGKFDSYLWLRLERHFFNIKKYHHTYKKKGDTISIDANIRVDSDIYLKDTLQDPSSNSHFENLYFKNYINNIIDNYQLTEIESLVFKNVIYLRDQGYCRFSKLIEKKCGLNRKTVDNALTRIKKKIPFDEVFM